MNIYFSKQLTSKENLPSSECVHALVQLRANKAKKLCTERMCNLQLNGITLIV